MNEALRYVLLLIPLAMGGVALWAVKHILLADRTNKAAVKRTKG